MKTVLADLCDREGLMRELADLSTREFDVGYHTGFAHGLREARALIEMDDHEE